MTTLYVSDLDGTLLDSQARISERSKEIISRLSRRGVLITVATARTPATVVPILAGTYTLPPAIVMTGAALWDRTKGCMSDVRLLPAEEVRPICAAMLECRVTPFVYTAGETGLKVYHSARSLTDAEMGFVDARLTLPLKRFYLSTPVPEECESSTVLIFGIAGTAEIAKAAEALRVLTSCPVNAYPDNYNPGKSLIEVFAPGVSKAAAVRRMARHLGADTVVAFGDNLNDLPMLREADVAVAVENALDEVKKEADVIIGPNYTDSVARYIAAQEGCPV